MVLIKLLEIFALSLYILPNVRIYCILFSTLERKQIYEIQRIYASDFMMGIKKMQNLKRHFETVNESKKIKNRKTEDKTLKNIKRKCTIFLKLCRTLFLTIWTNDSEIILHFFTQKHVGLSCLSPYVKPMHILMRSHFNSFSCILLAATT